LASQKYIRKGRKYSPDEVLVRIYPAGRWKKKIDLDGDMVKITSDRLFIFKKSLTCVRCGIKGSFLVKERCSGQPAFHLNLYAIDDDGNEILMTKDHIVPRSKFGPDHINNYQTMCRKCNAEKKDESETKRESSSV